MVKRRSRREALIDQLLSVGSASEPSGAATTTSIRLPVGLRAALDAAIELGLEHNLTATAVDALRGGSRNTPSSWHWRPTTRSTSTCAPLLARLAIATAELDGNDLSHHPELIERAAAELTEHRPNATPDDVLTYALALAAGLHAA